jgi:hypothetical protein
MLMEDMRDDLTLRERLGGRTACIFVLPFPEHVMDVEGFETTSFLDTELLVLFFFSPFALTLAVASWLRCLVQE